MPKYNIKIPQGIGKFNAVNRKMAIDQAMKVYRHLLDKMEENGDIYKVPDIAKLAETRNGMRELGIDCPIKPSRKLGRNRR